MVPHNKQSHNETARRGRNPRRATQLGTEKNQLSNTNDTGYRSALVAIAQALEALSEAKRVSAEALALAVTGDDYNEHLHSMATGEYAGACSAYTLVLKMIRDHQAGIA